MKKSHSLYPRLLICEALRKYSILESKQLVNDSMHTDVALQMMDFVWHLSSNGQVSLFRQLHSDHSGVRWIDGKHLQAEIR